MQHTRQRRKDKDVTLYIYHPIEVAALLKDASQINGEGILIADLLHDTLEYTTANQEEIISQFEPIVLQYVIEVTDDKSDIQYLCTGQIIDKTLNYLIE